MSKFDADSRNKLMGILPPDVQKRFLPDDPDDAESAYRIYASLQEPLRTNFLSCYSVDKQKEIVGSFNRIIDKKLSCDYEAIKEIKFIPNSDKFIICGEDNLYICTCDGNLRPLDFFNLKDNQINSMDLSPCGHYLVVVLEDILQILDLNSELNYMIEFFSKERNEIESVKFDPSGKYIAIQSVPIQNNNIIILDFQCMVENLIKQNNNSQYNVIWESYTKFKFEENCKFTSFCFNSDGTNLASSLENGIVKIYDLTKDSPQCISSFRAHDTKIFSLEFCKDDKYLATVANGEVKVWNKDNFSKPLRLHTINKPGDDLNDVDEGFYYKAHFSPNGEYLVIFDSFSDPTLWYWSYDINLVWREAQRVYCNDDEEAWDKMEREDEFTKCRYATFDPKSRYLLVALEDGQLVITDLLKSLYVDFYY